MPVIIPLNVIDDSLVEGPETVVITLTSIVSGDPDITLNANSAFLARTQNIADNDSATTIDLITANDTAPPAGHPTVPPGTNTDNITSINQPTIAGIAAAGSTVQLFDGLTLLGSTVADGTGNWSITVPSALTDGVHNLQAKATFLSNNYSLALIGGDDRYGDFQQFSADDDFGDRYWHVELRQSDENQNAHIYWHSGSGQLCRAVARRRYRDRKHQCRRLDGSWTITASTIPDGSHTVSARVFDIAGNQSVSATLGIVIDSVAPPVPSTPDLADGSDSGVSTPTISPISQPQP